MSELHKIYIYKLFTKYYLYSKSNKKLIEILSGIFLMDAGHTKLGILYYIFINYGI